METTAYHFHCNFELGNMLQFMAGDDAGKVAWLDINPITEPRCEPPALPPSRCYNSQPTMYRKLYASAPPLRHPRATMHPSMRHH